ncbi:MAG: hypothetical protein HC881_16295 [Leptolyngbyaceae cyanobacterium SL_7_1]|nr:hypothetical protein [Leptolyngbyaceae cyanobacterium SL_7_1]
MTFQLITIDLPQVPLQQIEPSILQALRSYGEPLRWAITAVDEAQQIMQIEAVVIVETGWSTLISSQRVRTV